jgi:integrase/recombinase XerD
MPQAKTLTAQELDRVLAYIKERPHAARNRVMLLLTVWTGMRVGEVAALTIADVRADNGEIKDEVYLAAERVKYRHARTVYINQRMRKELKQYVDSKHWIDGEQPLFATQQSVRKPFSANTLAQHFHYLYKRAGVSGASSHSGRRTFITTLANKGVSVRLLASLAGHRSIATTQQYIDVNDDLKRQAVELA